jgi:hypothetical protein
MHIHDFYSKLTSGTEGGRLFEALRHLPSMEDVHGLCKALYSDWPNWPAAASVAAQA